MCHSQLQSNIIKLHLRQASLHRKKHLIRRPFSVYSQSRQVTGSEKLDAVVILGGGLDESQSASLPAWVIARLSTGARIFSEQGLPSHFLTSNVAFGPWIPSQTSLFFPMQVTAALKCCVCEEAHPTSQP